MLGVAGITVLDEKFFRPMRASVSETQFLPALLGIQCLDGAGVQQISLRSIDYWSTIITSSPVRIDQRLAASGAQPVKAPEKGAMLRHEQLVWHDSVVTVQSVRIAQASTPMAFDRAQQMLATGWRDRFPVIHEEGEAFGKAASAPRFHDSENALTLLARRTKKSLGGGSSSPASRKALTPSKAAKGSKTKSKATSKKAAPQSIRRKKASPASWGVAASLLKGRRAKGGTGVQSRSYAPLVHLKPIAPGATIKPQKAHDSWRKARKQPIFSWPVDPAQFWVSSPFGPRKKPNGSWALHAGVDLAAVRGTPVRASREGRVVKATYSSGYGNYILIEHSKKYQTRYAHLDKILVRVGQTVCAGDYIGRVGSTGFVRKSRWGSSGSHLHFEVYVYGKAKDPFYFLA